MAKYYADSKVEVSGFLAKHYDFLLNFATFGVYENFIKKAIEYMSINIKDKILDLGCGTGKNACLMRSYLSKEGSIVGLDISEEMVRQFRKKCNIFPNAKIIFARADKTLSFKNEVFDKVLASFLIHGFPQNVREKLIEEVYRVLKNKGKLFILDYNQFKF